MCCRQFVLRRGVALLSGQTVPGDCFSIILWDAVAVGVAPPEAVLREGVTGLGTGTDVCEKLRTEGFDSG